MVSRLLLVVVAVTASGCQYVQFEESLGEVGTVIDASEFAGEWKNIPPADDMFGPSDQTVDMRITLNDDQTCTVSFPKEEQRDRCLVNGRLVRVDGKTFFEIVSVEMLRHDKKIVSTRPEEFKYCNLFSVARRGSELLVSWPKVEEFRDAVFETGELEGHWIDYLSNQIAIVSEPEELAEFLSNHHDRIFLEPRRFRLLPQPDKSVRE